MESLFVMECVLIKEWIFVGFYKVCENGKVGGCLKIDGCIVCKICVLYYENKEII